MSQRSTASISSTSAQHSAAGTGQQQQEQRQYVESNHLMPHSLTRIPDWYQTGPFRFNLRFFVGALPSILLITTVSGKIMVTSILLGLLVTLLLRNTQMRWVAMIVSIGHVFLLEVVNIYCMVPLIWRSILNAPLLGLFHLIIAINGVWWWLQDEEFKNQDPRFIILIERLLFYLYPCISVTAATWICGMVFGRIAIPYAICLSGIIALSLFMVPLQSSFAKPQTPTEVGLVQHKVVVWLYFALELSVPAVLYSALSYDGSLVSILVMGLFMCAPPFLLTLLEAQGLFYWTGLSPTVLRITRLIFGTLVMAHVSTLIYILYPSSYLPLLLVPVLFTQLALVSRSDHSPFSPPTLVLAAVLCLLYSVAFLFLPWNISHSFSFLSLPLSLVQLLLWALALATVVMVTLWKRITPQLWVVYNSLFVLSEYILSNDNVYPPFVSVATGAVGLIMFWRLYLVGQLRIGSCLFNICLHLTKLSLLLPSAPSPSHTLTNTLLTTVAIFLISYVVLREMLFEQSSSSSQLLVHSGLLVIGLLVSWDAILVPLWASLTHQLPSTASLVATIMVLVGLFVMHGQGLIREKSDRPTALQYFPPGLLTMAALLAVLQPEFNLAELWESFMILLSDHSQFPAEIPLAAWTNLLTWVTLYIAVFVLIQLSTNYIESLTTVALAFLGCLAGMLTTLSLLHLPPFSLLGMLYAAMLGVGGALLGRTYSAKHSGSIVDNLMFIVMSFLFIFCYMREWTSLPNPYLPWKPFYEYYAMPCTKLFIFTTLAMAVAFRAKMYKMLEQPYLPLVANTCCLFFFLLSLLHPIHHQLEVSVILCSCVFLLAQADGHILPKTNNIFLAPSLLASMAVLVAIATSRIVPTLPMIIRQSSRMYLTARVCELVTLLFSLPGQFVFIYYLWTGKQMKMNLYYLIFCITPNAILPQFSSNTASTLLGTTGVLSFCLLLVGDYANMKIV